MMCAIKMGPKCFITFLKSSLECVKYNKFYKNNSNNVSSSSSTSSSNSSIFLRNDSFQEVQNAHGDLRNRDQVETGEETNVTEYHADEDKKIENR